MRKKIVAIVALLIIIISSSSLVFALGFTDVPYNHWAKDYINDMQQKGIISGYEDATFKPENNVTKMEAIKMIYSVLKEADLLNDAKINEMLNTQSLTLNRYAVPTWAREAVAFSLSEKIIAEGELATFMNSDKTNNNASKGEVSVYLGKALVKALDIEVGNKIYSFDFHDEFNITFAMAPYVDLLIERKIVSGDELGNFNSDKPISRSVIAKMLSVSNDIIEDEGKNLYEEEIKENEVSKTVSGEVVLISEKNNTIVILNKDEKQEIYKMIDDVEVFINQDEEDLDDLDEEDQIVLSLNDDENVIKIEKNGLSTFQTGTFYNVIGDQDIYLITLKNEENEKHTFKSIKTSYVNLKVNGNTASYNELEKGAKITKLELNSKGEIETLYLTTEPDIYEGILLTGIYYKEKPMIDIRTYGSKELTLEVDEDADVEKNNRDTSLSALSKGDIVKLELDDGIVDEIIATSIQEDTEGRISKIIIGKTNQLVIVNSDGDETTYEIDDNVDIEIDDSKNKDIYDLRYNDKVEIELEGSIIIDIEAKSTTTTKNFSGIITDMYKDDDVIAIDSDDFDDVVSVDCDDATIFDVDGDIISFSRLDEDDEVLIFAEEESKLFDYTATRIYKIR